MKCKYCRHWRECRSSLINHVKISDTRTISERLCKMCGERKRGDDEACEDMLVHLTFFCKARGHKIAVIPCLYCQGLLKRKPPTKYNLYPECGNHAQCFEIRDLTRGRNLLIEHGYTRKREGYYYDHLHYDHSQPKEPKKRPVPLRKKP